MQPNFLRRVKILSIEIRDFATRNYLSYPAMVGFEPGTVNFEADRAHFMPIEKRRSLIC
jgi:hypothetical protein